MKILYRHFAKIGLFLIAIAITMSIYGQETTVHLGNFSFAPQKPTSADQITISYSPDPEYAKIQTISANVYFLKGESPSLVKIHLLKKENNFEGVFRAPDSLKVVFIKFVIEDFEDNNNQNGYFFPFYKDSLPVPGAFIEIGRIFGPYSSALGIEKNLEKGVGFLQQEFELHASSKEKYLPQYVYVLNYFKKSNDPEAKQFFEDIERKQINSETRLAAIENYWRTIGNTTKAGEIKKLIETRFPRGMWLKNQKINAFDKETNLTRKAALYEEIAALFPPKTSAEKYTFDDDLTWELMEALALAGQYEKIPQYDVRMYNADELAGVYNEISFQLIGLTIRENSKDLAKGKEYNEKAFQILEPVRAGRDTLQNRYYTLLRVKALIHYKEGYFTAAYQAQKVAAKGFNGKRPDYNEALCAYSEKVAGTAEAKRELETFIKTGIYTSGMKEQLKRIYLLNKSEETWYDYFASLNKDYLQKTRNELLKQIVNELAPIFNLKDLNGNNINLKNLRGKIVVLDFWATWCVPCIKRFPGMQKTIDRYKNDPDVVFLFINTWERVPETEREKLITQFFKDNSYSFRILLDERLENENQYRCANDFKIEGVPTKIIINKIGNIIFREIGGSLDSDLFVEEMTIMIDIANSTK